MNGTAYLWEPDRYQDFSTPQFRLGGMAVERLAPAAHERILEIGSGNGLVTIELARKIPRGSIVGIEISKEMYLKALKNVEEHSLTNIDLRNMDALDIRFAGEFDAVFSNSAIHWIEDQRRIYELIFESLKPGGRIMIQTGMKELNRLTDAFIAMYRSGKYQSFMSGVRIPWKFLTPDETEQLLSGIGFERISVEAVPYRHRFDSAEQLSGYLESAALVPFLSILPDDQKAGFKEFVLATYLSLNQGSTDLSMMRLFISARRP